MILVNDVIVKPTIFPDGTSQVWKLPADVVNEVEFNVTWYFEHEREIVDVASLAVLFRGAKTTLFMPYLPYARQDKGVANNATFNLHAFARLLDGLLFDEVTAVDAHNADEASSLIPHFSNMQPRAFHRYAIERYRPDWICFPDAGARARYVDRTIKHQRYFIAEKKRDPSTGEIKGLHVDVPANLEAGQRVLVVDDICDGGGTFIALAGILPRGLGLGLAVTHGIFSKGKEPLTAAGFTDIYTTNSLIKNQEGFPV